MSATTLPPTAENIARAAELLRAGGVVGMPTETVYGLAGMAFDEHALTSIFAVKERPTFDPLICHVRVIDNAFTGDWIDWLAQQGLIDASRLANVARDRVNALANAFWPGPLTLVLPKTSHVPDLATSGLPTVGVRSPNHPVAQQLLQAVGTPLAAPSANRFGRISPTSAGDVAAELGDRIEIILDGGPCAIGIESTVLLVEPGGELILLRPGGVSASDLQSAAQVDVVSTRDMAATSTPLPSPGLLASHYAPSKPLYLFEQPLASMDPGQRQRLLREFAMRGQAGLLITASDIDDFAGLPAIVCSHGDAAQAARALFAALRSLDEHAEVQEIWAEPFPADAGLGYAINDRLRKAAHRG